MDALGFPTWDSINTQISTDYVSKAKLIVLTELRDLPGHEA